MTTFGPVTCNRSSLLRETAQSVSQLLLLARGGCLISIAAVYLDGNLTKEEMTTEASVLCSKIMDQYRGKSS